MISEKGTLETLAGSIVWDEVRELSKSKSKEVSYQTVVNLVIISVKEVNIKFVLEQNYILHNIYLNFN